MCWKPSAATAGIANLTLTATASRDLDSDADNKPQFAFRGVTVVNPVTNQYAAAEPGRSYDICSTLRYDLIEVVGTEIGGGIDGDVNGDGCVNDSELVGWAVQFRP